MGDFVMVWVLPFALILASGAAGALVGHRVSGRGRLGFALGLLGPIG